ncbi:MAG: glycosyltransferase [Candidatus Bathyarchaeia archaeon]
MYLPRVDFKQLLTLTDDTGILQHSKFLIPDRKEGYTTDDNARALIVCLKYHQICDDESLVKLIRTYLSFLMFMQRADGRYHNLLSYSHDFLDEVSSDDSLGRVLWSCGYALGKNHSEDLNLTFKEIFDKALPWAMRSSAPRAKALALLGLCHYFKAFPMDDNARSNIMILAEGLLKRYNEEAAPDWPWFEPYLTYINAKLSQVLFKAYSIIGDERYMRVAEDSFNFLIRTQILEGVFVPIGNDGWYVKGGQRAKYDQQPTESACMVETATTAFHVTRDEKYIKIARIAFDWFLGKNSKNVEVYNPKTGGCYDGITPQGLNLNQGSESTICYLLARLEMEKLNNLSKK